MINTYWLCVIRWLICNCCIKWSVIGALNSSCNQRWNNNYLLYMFLCIYSWLCEYSTSRDCMEWISLFSTFVDITASSRIIFSLCCSSLTLGYSRMWIQLYGVVGFLKKKRSIFSTLVLVKACIIPHGYLHGCFNLPQEGSQHPHSTCQNNHV